MDRTQRIPRWSGDRAGWPVPPAPPESAIGLTLESARRVFDRDGFYVEAFISGVHGGWDMNLTPSRIRVFVEDGVVLDATQG